jgi:uncharacterized phiE125 gp8 family phage protein
MAIPVTLDDAKRQLRLELDDASQDVEIAGFIADAVDWVEKYTGHILAARDVTESFRGFRPVALRAWPVAADAVAGVAYTNADGVAVAIPGARIDLSQGRARIAPGTGAFWPFIDSQQAFTVTIRAGYEDDDAVPGNLRRAMLVLIGAYDADREGGEVFEKAETSARKLCAGFRPRSV